MDNELSTYKPTPEQIRIIQELRDSAVKTAAAILPAPKLSDESIREMINVALQSAWERHLEAGVIKIRLDKIERRLDALETPKKKDKRVFFDRNGNVKRFRHSDGGIYDWPEDE